MEAIYKLQPHRTMHLQGFDAYGAGAALWGASDTGFTVSGVFRDQADFAVLVLFQEDDPFGHPRFSYLPDGNFTGLKLDYDVEWDGVQAFESKKSAWSDWDSLNCVLADGSTTHKKLSDIASTAAVRTGASGVFALHGTPADGDQVMLRYQNRTYSYTVGPSSNSSVQVMWWQGNSAYVHSVTIAGTSYTVTEGALGSASIASDIAGQINASDLNCTASVGGTYSNEITITLAAGISGPVSVSSSDGSTPAILAAVTLASICSDLASQINAEDWVINGPVALSAAAAGNQVTITAEPGADGNMVTFYALTTDPGLYVTPATLPLAGGSSDDVMWHITADFSALGWTDIQKLYLTFAPALANGAAYADTEWRVHVTNWSVTDASGTRALKVAGPGSVRIEEDRSWVARAGYWEAAPGADPGAGFAFWSGGRAIRAAHNPGVADPYLTIETHCQSAHDIYVGTLLDTDCGIISASLDGGAAVPLDCYSDTRGTVRRKLFSGVSAGSHSVQISITNSKNTASSGWYFYFDFLECAVPTDVPDAPETRTDVALSTDYDTDATYKLSPQRLIWNIQKIGLIGEVDHYAGVFWWKQSTRTGGAFPACTVAFSGTWAPGNVIWLNFGGAIVSGVLTGGTAVGKTVLDSDTPDTIAGHFAWFINSKLVGVWASASGGTLTIQTRSTFAEWMYPFFVQCASEHASDVTVTGGVAHTEAADITIISTGALQTGAAEGTWTIDAANSQVFSRGFRDWHADYFSALQAAGIDITVSFSQELVNPPDNPGSGAVWIQRFPDGAPVSTATGFGTLYSSQIAFGSTPEAYMRRVYAGMAGLMATAGLTPRLQFGEVLWWFQANAAGMAFYDADTAAAASAALGRSLVTFHAPGDDPAVNGYTDANFLRARLKAYVDAIRTYVLAAYPSAEFELLWPLDVNDPDNCRLLRYINLPPEWTARSGSGFDTFMCEGFQYGGVNHSIEQARRCARYPFTELSWDRAHCRYLMGWFYSGWPWVREYFAARRPSVPLLKTWAYDHICLFGWPLPLPAEHNYAALV